MSSQRHARYFCLSRSNPRNSAEERWGPYFSWARRLDAEDVLVSFNYDRVIELLEKDQHVKVHVAVVERSGYENNQSKVAGRPFLYKPHGSVDWFWNEKREIERAKSFESLLKKDRNIALASPGRAKVRMSQNDFRSLWKKAMNDVAEAEEVYFLGYRCPESDSYPRSRLLKAVCSDPDKKVFTVLGPEVDGKDSRRISALLRTATSANLNEETQKSNVRAVPLYVEDFLELWPELKNNSGCVLEKLAML